MAKLKLMSSDNQAFEVDEAVANMSSLVSDLTEDEAFDKGQAIPITNVPSNVLAKVLEFCKFHVEAKVKGEDGKLAKTEEQIKTWEADFLKDNPGLLFDLILAANYMNVKELLALTTQRVLDDSRGKSADEIRRFYGFLTPQEEEQARKEKATAAAGGSK